MPVRYPLTLAFIGLTLSAGIAGAAVTEQDRQQAACYSDVQKLCGQFVPDTQKTEACMLKMKNKVSARCRKYYTD